MGGKLTEKTLIPIGMVLGLLSTLVGATMWATTLYNRTNTITDRVLSLEQYKEEHIKQLQQINITLAQILGRLDSMDRRARRSEK